VRERCRAAGKNRDGRRPIPNRSVRPCLQLRRVQHSPNGCVGCAIKAAARKSNVSRTLSADRRRKAPRGPPSRDRVARAIADAPEARGCVPVAEKATPFSLLPASDGFLCGGRRSAPIRTRRARVTPIGHDHSSFAGLSIFTGPRLEGRSSASFGERTSRPGQCDPAKLGFVGDRPSDSSRKGLRRPYPVALPRGELGGPAWLMLTMRGLTARLGFWGTGNGERLSPR
jgi:hypothetical protein